MPCRKSRQQEDIFPPPAACGEISSAGYLISPIDTPSERRDPGGEKQIEHRDDLPGDQTVPEHGDRPHIKDVHPFQKGERKPVPDLREDPVSGWYGHHGCQDNKSGADGQRRGAVVQNFREKHDKNAHQGGDE